MSKEQDKDLTRGANPLEKYLPPRGGTNVFVAIRSVAKKALHKAPHLQRTPRDKLRLTELPVTKGELTINERKWVNSSPSCRDFREMCERYIVGAVRMLRPDNWITASIEQRITALQALEIRLHKMQGRHEVYKVNVSDDVKDGSLTDTSARTITLNSKIVKSATPADALAALFKAMHLLMQREAVKDPKSFAEHGLKNIQRLAEPENGRPSLCHLDAISYATRQMGVHWSHPSKSRS